MIIYKTPEITVRQLEQEDEHLLLKWMNDPCVLEYYEGRDRLHDLELVRTHFYPQDSTVRCIIEINNKPIEINEIND